MDKKHRQTCMTVQFCIINKFYTISSILVPEENVSWMLFSAGGAQLELRLGFGGERLLTLAITHHAEYMGVLLYVSKRTTVKMRTQKGGNIPLVSAQPSWLLDVSTRSVLLSGLGYVSALIHALVRPEIMESFGVITVQSFRTSGLCAARDRVSAQYPVMRCTLPRAQSRLH
jgi:hypothetical protein